MKALQEVHRRHKFTQVHVLEKIYSLASIKLLKASYTKPTSTTATTTNIASNTTSNSTTVTTTTTTISLLVPSLSNQVQLDTALVNLYPSSVKFHYGVYNEADKDLHNFTACNLDIMVGTGN